MVVAVSPLYYWWSQVHPRLKAPRGLALCKWTHSHVLGRLVGAASAVKTRQPLFEFCVDQSLDAEPRGKAFSLIKPGSGKISLKKKWSIQKLIPRQFHTLLWTFQWLVPPLLCGSSNHSVTSRPGLYPWSPLSWLHLTERFLSPLPLASFSHAEWLTDAEECGQRQSFLSSVRTFALCSRWVCLLWISLWITLKDYRFYTNRRQGHPETN